MVPQKLGSTRRDPYFGPCKLIEGVHLYTDGSCLRPDGPGGWGFVLKWNEHVKELAGGEATTTNNRMELMAVIQGLKALKGPVVGHVYSDSQYVLKGITQWINGWMRRDWRNAEGVPVANKDLWLELYQEIQQHDLDWYWIRGHVGHPENERCDVLAGQQSRRMQALSATV